MKRLLTRQAFAYTAGILLLSSAQAVHAAVISKTLTLGSEVIRSSVIDPAAGYAYLTSQSTPGKVIKVRLSDMSIAATQIFPEASGGFLPAAIIDTTNGYAYFAVIPLGVLRVHLADLGDGGLLILSQQVDAIGSATIDPAGGFAYFAGTSPNGDRIVKMRLSDAQEVGNQALANSQNALTWSDATIDPAGGFAYFLIGSNPQRLSKIRLSDLAEVGSLMVQPPLSLRAGTIDTVDGYLYYAGEPNGSTHAQVVQIRLPDLKEVQRLPVLGLVSGAQQAVANTATGLAYFGGYGMFDIALSTSNLNYFPWFSGPKQFYAGLLDPVHQVLYMAVTNGALDNSFVQIDLSSIYIEDPSQATVGTQSLQVTLVGHAFATDDIVQWNGSNRTTQVINATKLNFTLTAADMAHVGISSVTLFNPYAGSSGTTTVPFEVTVGTTGIAAAVTSISPNEASAGDPDFTLTVNGSGFFPTLSFVDWNNFDLRPPVVLSSTQLTVQVPASLLSNAGIAQVTVVNSGATPSSPLPFTILAIPGQPQFTHLLPVMSLNDSIGVTATGNPSEYDWMLTPEAAGTSLSAGTLGRASGTISLTASTHNGTLSLNTVSGLGIGQYQLQVVAKNALGKSSPPAEAVVSVIAGDLGSVRVHPNPWISSQNGSQMIIFDHLTGQCTIKLFTLSGHWIKTLQSNGGMAMWDRTNDSGDSAASGLYIYLITNDQGEKARGKLSIVK